MKKILIPTDFSNAARYAIIYGASLAQSMNASVTLLNAYNIPVIADNAYLDPSMLDSWQKDSEKILGGIAYRLRKAHPAMDIKTKVVFGFAAEKILGLSVGYDLIIMGSKGRGGLGDKIFGNVTADVIRSSKIPVLVIPPHVHYHTLKNILVACQNENLITPVAEEMIKEFANTFHARIRLLNVVKEFTDVTPEYAGTYVSAYNTGEKIKAHFEGMDVAVDILENKNVTEQINSFSNLINADMIIMLRQKHSWLQRIFTEIHTRYEMKITQKPLLIIPG